MMKWIETTGKNEEEAIQKALRELGLDRDCLLYTSPSPRDS